MTGTAQPLRSMARPLTPPAVWGRERWDGAVMPWKQWARMRCLGLVSPLPAPTKQLASPSRPPAALRRESSQQRGRLPRAARRVAAPAQRRTRARQLERMQPPQAGTATAAWQAARNRPRPQGQVFRPPPAQAMSRAKRRGHVRMQRGPTVAPQRSCTCAAFARVGRLHVASGNRQASGSSHRLHIVTGFR